ncbi:hypothetical protein Tco_0915642 [Tanacetum coccineum]
MQCKNCVSKPQREETYQVTLDVLKLSPCYPAFLITTEVPEVYMHQFWNTIQKIKDIDAYRFKLDKKKFRVDIEVFHEILQIFPRLPNQAFVVPPSEEELVTFIQELGYSGKCDTLSAIHTDRTNLGEHLLQSSIDFMYQADNREISSARKEHMPYPRFTKVIINHFISKDKTISMRNRINLYIIRDDSLLEKPKRARKHAKKSTNVPTAGVVIRVTPQALQKKKKDSYMLHASRSGHGVGSQLKVLDKSEDNTTGTNEGTGAKPGVLDVPKYLSKSENESWGDSGDDESNDDDSDEVTKDDDEDDVESDANKDKEASDSEKTDSDEDENLNVNQNDDEEEEHKEEYVHTPNSFEFNDDDEEYNELYKDVNVRSKVAKHKEVGKGDADMTDTTHESSSQEKSFEQVIEDAYVTLTSSQKTEGSKQSYSVSSDF